MKTSFVRQCSLGMVAGLTFLAGCTGPSAEPEQPKAASAPPILPVVAQAAPVTPLTDPATNTATPDATDTNAPAIVERIPASAKPENVQMSAGLSEVVKLAQAGVGEEVILAYAEKYSGRFDVGADQILYLNDLGVSGTLIASMLKHDGAPDQGQAVAGAPSLVQTQAVSNVPQAQVTEQTAPPTVTTGTAPPPTSTEVSYFYDSLSPYGSWVYLSGYGWCWQPTVAVSVATWRPYCDRGRWYWSDAGWYWNSDYSWGWATFHYGRWYRHPGCGWVWTPGVVWAPSWVSWRYYDGYCGWAPLPPEAHFASGVGFTYYGKHVAVGFDFGLHDYHYAFVHVNNFCDYAPYRYVVPHGHVQNFYRNTTVINNYTVRNNNTVINQGIGRDAIARASQTRFREVSIRETPVNNVANVHGDRIEKEGNRTVVYRPQLPKTPPTVRSAQFASRSTGAAQPATTVGRAPDAGAGNLAPSGPSHGGSSRGQAGVAQRATGNANVESTRSQPNANQERGTTTTRNTGNTVERNAERGNQQRSVPAPARPQGQPRSNGPLFGSGAANTVQPNNNVAGRVAVPRTTAPVPPTQPQQQTQPSRIQPQSQPQAQQQQARPTYSRPMPVYPGTQTQQPAARVERNNGPAMTPRQLEQQPRYSSPVNQAPAPYTPRYTNPSSERQTVRQAESGRAVESTTRSTESIRTQQPASASPSRVGRSESAPSRGNR